MSVKERRKQARTAVKNFNLMIPSLRMYARTITGNPTLKLKAGQSSQTDGKTIWIEPPLSLGVERKHNGMCDTSADGMSVCAACAAREELMEVLHHEIGHIVHGSFDDWRYGAVSDALSATTIDRSAVARMTQSITGGVKAHGKPLIYHVNTAQHPWLSLIMLVMEDVRCDEARLRFDPTQQEVFDALAHDLLNNGINRSDGTIERYSDLDKNAQACLGFLFASRGYDLDGYFSDEVVELLQDFRIVDLIEEALNAVDTTHSFQLTLKLLELYNERDFCNVDNLSDEEIEEIIQMLSELLEAMIGHGLGISETNAPPSARKGAGGRGSDGSDGQPSDGLRPSDIADALKALQTLDHVPLNVAAPIVNQQGHGESYDRARYYTLPRTSEFVSDERNLSPAIGAARIAFSENAKIERHRNMRSGRVAGKMLAKRVPFGDDRVFAKKVQPDTRNYAVVIGMDISGSTSGETLREEKMAVLAMADVLARLGIQFEIWAHASKMLNDADCIDAPDLYPVKMSNQPWNATTKEYLRRLCPTGSNLDGHTLQFYRKRLELMQSTDKILMYYTDGAMPASNYEEELKVIKSEIEYCKKNDIALMAVGMGVDSPKDHGFDTFRLDDEKGYRKVVEHLGKRLQ